MAQFDRADFLQQLEMVQPGLAKRDVLEQSSCFVWQGGKLMTFNDHMACQKRMKVKLNGAVKAEALLLMLRKMTEQTIEVSQEGNELKIQGKGRHASFRMETEVTLPIEHVTPPEEWTPLPEDFADAIGIVEQVAGTDESFFNQTCVHIHPKWVEASGPTQVCRYRVRTKVSAPVLLQASSVKHIVPMGMVEFSETEGWVHFRNNDHLVFSCRRHLDPYPDVSEPLKREGSPITLPKGLAEAADRAQIFSGEDKDRNFVTISLNGTDSRLKLVSEGSSGSYRENKKVTYSGPSLKFRISPLLLIELTKRYNEAEIGETHLKVNGGKFTYVTCLGAAEDQEAPPQEEGEEDPAPKKKSKAAAEG